MCLLLIFAYMKRMFWPVHWSLCTIDVLHFDSGSHYFLKIIWLLILRTSVLSSLLKVLSFRFSTEWTSLLLVEIPCILFSKGNTIRKVPVLHHCCDSIHSCCISKCFCVSWIKFMNLVVSFLATVVLNNKEFTHMP